MSVSFFKVNANARQGPVLLEGFFVGIGGDLNMSYRGDCGGLS